MKASIDRIKWIEGEGSTRAYIDICFDGAVVCKGFKIMNSVKGPFLAPPSHKDKNSDKWFPDITFKSRDIQDSFQEHILALAKKSLDGSDPSKSEWSEDGAIRGLQDMQHQEKTPQREAAADLTKQFSRDQGKIQDVAPMLYSCELCHAGVIEMPMKNGQKVWVDASSVPVGATHFDRDIMIRHDETCTGVANGAHQ